MGSAASPLVVAVSTDAAATTGSGSGSSSASGAAVCSLAGHWQPCLGAHGPRARSRDDNALFLREVFERLSETPAALPPWDRPQPRRSLLLGRLDGASRLVPLHGLPSLRRALPLHPLSCWPPAHLPWRAWRVSAPATPGSFLFGEFLEGLVEQLGWHFYLGWRCLYGCRLCRGCGLRGPPGLSPPGRRFGCRGGGFRRQLRRGTIGFCGSLGI